jgi:hypothetical protein
VGSESSPPSTSPDTAGTGLPGRPASGDDPITHSVLRLTAAAATLVEFADAAVSDVAEMARWGAALPRVEIVPPIAATRVGGDDGMGRGVVAPRL